MSAEWGPWIAHDGSGCPVPAGSFVEVEMRRFTDSIVECARLTRADTAHEVWRNVAPGYPHAQWPEIRAYRVRRPFGITILEGWLRRHDDEVVS